MRSIIALCTVVMSIVGMIPVSASASQQYITDSINSKKKLVSSTINPSVYQAAYKAYQWAKTQGQLGNNKKTLTIIDFDLPSNQKRLWVFDLKNKKLLLNTYTTHAKNSGLLNAIHFSNHVNSDESSLGMFVTLNEYTGKHGLSMRLKGLEQNINSNAYKRNIVIHSAWYVKPAFIKQYHRLGRSLGCFAVPPQEEKKLLRLIKGGSAFFVYAKQESNDPIIHDI